MLVGRGVWVIVAIVVSVGKIVAVIEGSAEAVNVGMRGTLV